MVLYCAADLLWATRIKATADALGIPCRPARSVEMLEARLGDSDVRGVIVDLEAGENALAVVRGVRAREPGRRSRVVGFGPQVAGAAFEAAGAGGAGRVLAGGAFDRGLTEILKGLEEGGAPAGN